MIHLHLLRHQTGRVGVLHSIEGFRALMKHHAHPRRRLWRLRPVLRVQREAYLLNQSGLDFSFTL